MAINFPNSPTVGQTYTYNSREYEWTGVYWKLKIAVGPQGPQGPQGVQGPTGTGITLKGTVTDIVDLPPSGNTVGDLYIVTNEDGDGYAWDGVQWNNVGPIQGPQGNQGAQGVAGDTGPQGSQGSQGAQGEVGAQGFQGNQGHQGAQGNQGFQGEVGAQGPQGVAGDTGPQGNQGFQGEPGAQGPQGATGSQGPQGDVGATGPQGPQGESGSGGGGDITVVGRTTTVTIPVSGLATTVFTFPFEVNTYYVIEMFIFFTGGGIYADVLTSVGTVNASYGVFEGFVANTNIVPRISIPIQDGAGSLGYNRGIIRWNSPSSGTTCDIRMQDSSDTYTTVIQPGSYIKVIKIGAIP